MKKSLLLWVITIILTLVTAIYQRITGPTYPISGSVTIAEKVINYKLDRSHGGDTDHKISIEVRDTSITGYVYYKRYKTDDNWTKNKMEYEAGKLTSLLPHQPPAGKLEYFIELDSKSGVKKFPENNSVVIRFKGDVPLYILIPHIIAMFMSMLLSNRTGLEFFNNGKNLKKLTIWTIVVLVIGGFILGPLTQKFAFGEFWTGIPFGHDLTDNKTLIALIGWLVALFMYKRSRRPARWALFAAILLIAVYLIPHSVMGSELDYNKIDKQTITKKIQ